MHVFLSYSGERSERVARALRDWLPSVLHALKPWVSAHDIQAGEFWDTSLRDALRNAEFVIVCITPENRLLPWINYEAGATAERLGGKLCPYLYKLSVSELHSPLNRLQAKAADHDGTLSLIRSLNDKLRQRANYALKPSY